MFQRKNISALKRPPLKDYDIIIDYSACMVSISLTTHLVDVLNVSNQWSARQLSEHLNSRSHLSSCSNFFINSVALMHGFILFRRELTRRGILIIKMYQEEKAVPSYHHLKQSRMSIEIKFSSYFTPHLSEADLLNDIILLRNDLLKRNKYEASRYSCPSSVFGNIELSKQQSRTTVEVGTNTKDTVSANLRKSPSDLTDRSIKNVTTKVITSVEGVVGERNSLYFLRSAVKILDFKKRKREVLEQDEIEQDSSGDECGNDDCSEY